MHFKIDWKWLIGILIAIIPFIYSSNFFQKDKELCYEVLQIINKKSIHGIENNDDIVFGFKDGNSTHLTDNLSIITIRFINSGKSTLQRSEFDIPITIEIPEGVKYLQSQISFVKPKDLHIESKLVDNSIRLNPMLLNPDDEFTISIILDGVVDDITPTARIVGVTELTKIEHKNKEKNNIKFIIGIFLMIYLAIYLDIVISNNSRKSLLWYFPAFLITEYTAITFTTENMIFDISLGYSYILMLLIFIITMIIYGFINFPRSHSPE